MFSHELKQSSGQGIVSFLLGSALLCAAPQAQDTAKPRREPIRVGTNVQESKLLYRVPPAYPPQAKAARISGVVILQATINEAGEVAEVRVLRGHPLLDHAAVNAVKQWRYSPTLLDGDPVPVIATVTLIFELGPGLTVEIDEFGAIKDASTVLQDEDLVHKLKEAQGVASVTPHPQLPFRLLEERLRSLQNAGAREFRLSGPYIFNEGALFYTKGSLEVQPPEIVLETERLAAIVRDSGRMESGPPARDAKRMLLYQMFLNELGEIVSIRQLHGPQIPELEAELLHTRVISPGRRGVEAVPFALIVQIAVE